jgi:hypothetical protein
VLRRWRAAVLGGAVGRAAFAARWCESSSKWHRSFISFFCCLFVFLATQRCSGSERRRKTKQKKEIFDHQQLRQCFFFFVFAHQIESENLVLAFTGVRFVKKKNGSKKNLKRGLKKHAQSQQR